MPKSRSGACLVLSQLKSTDRDCVNSHRLGLEARFTDEQLEAIEREFAPIRHRVRCLLALQSLLGPLVENAVLIDRLLFLHEHSQEMTRGDSSSSGDGSAVSADSKQTASAAVQLRTTLVPAFDPMLSPRNMVIVAIKPAKQTKSASSSATMPSLSASASAAVGVDFSSS